MLHPPFSVKRRGRLVHCDAGFPFPVRSRGPSCIFCNSWSVLPHFPTLLFEKLNIQKTNRSKKNIKQIVKNCNTLIHRYFNPLRKIKTSNGCGNMPRESLPGHAAPAHSVPSLGPAYTYPTTLSPAIILTLQPSAVPRQVD